MAMITVQQTGIPSRSKQAGPCWVAVHVPHKPASDETRTVYANPAVVTFEVPDDALLRVSAKVTLRRATRAEVARREWTVRVTGSPDDRAVCALGSPQSIEATLTGVVEVEAITGHGQQ
jgi:hypothetical protein